MSVAIGGIAAAIWAVLLFGRSGWWRARERDARVAGGLDAWPMVVAIVPARDEAEVVGRAIASLAAQDYPGEFRIVLVDDGSTDGTAETAISDYNNALHTDAATRHPRESRDDGRNFEVLTALPLAPGWTGKLAAVAQGIAHAGDAPAYFLLTDADIEHAPDTVRSLVARAVSGNLVLTSLMARLRCVSFAERALVPAFVYFFAMLFPFNAVARPGPVAAAAGGVMLADRAALARAGGIAVIRNALIDDCALAKVMKAQGPIALLLTDRSVSLRSYPCIGDIGAMISRSAYAQLGYSPWRLGGTLLGLALTFVAAPVLALSGSGFGQLLGFAAWGMISASFQPMLRFYRRSPAWGAALPLIAAVYGWYTLVSAVQTWRGAGGRWKGRVQAPKTRNAAA